MVSSAFSSSSRKLMSQTGLHDWIFLFTVPLRMVFPMHFSILHEDEKLQNKSQQHMYVPNPLWKDTVAKQKEWPPFTKSDERHSRCLVWNEYRSWIMKGWWVGVVLGANVEWELWWRVSVGDGIHEWEMDMHEGEWCRNGKGGGGFMKV